MKHYYKQGDQWKEYSDTDKPAITAKETLEIQHKIKLKADIMRAEENKEATSVYKDNNLTPSQINITIPYELAEQSK
ncbi:hypothetical protein [Candidatus Phytoplasma pruni]|uniref:Uncharacterized protein n=1 Tax=Candidatus Phytoplasma pruni TaxID=479893 RepID=A0A851HCT8_9MOLU|nr:hypothetical protein [Candidatus Phytoplasma pruni]NWN45885.1 hypothetical protein [Candidatus Phytoplasma pruni]